MTWKQWTAVVAVIGFGIVAQIRTGDEDVMPEHTALPMPDTAAPMPMDDAEPRGPHRTIALEVAGMT